MALRKILTDKDESLHRVCKPIDKFDDKLATLLDDMHETLDKAQGLGLAAPQVGVIRRAVIVDVGEGVIELINPVIIEQEGEQTTAEGCLSMPGEYGLTKRPMKVKVRAQDRNGEFFEISGEGLLAKAFCHELDHLEGILYKDIVIRMLDPEELEE